MIEPLLLAASASSVVLPASNQSVAEQAVTAFLQDLGSGAQLDVSEINLRAYGLGESATLADVRRFTTECALQEIGTPFPSLEEDPILAKWTCDEGSSERYAVFHTKAGNVVEVVIGHSGDFRPPIKISPLTPD